MIDRIETSVADKAKKGVGVCVGILLVLLAYIIVQLFALHAPFLHGDDENEVAFVNAFDVWWRCFGADVFTLFRPVKNLLFLGFARLSDWGMPWCRAAAILIGVGSFFPVFAFFRRILKNERASLLAAAIWLLSPTLVSSVAWLSCVNIQLMCAFAALAFCGHIDGKPLRAGIWLLLACLSYELAIVLGPALVLYDFFLRPDRFRSRIGWRQYAGYAVLTVAYLAMRQVVGCAGGVNGSFVGCTRADLILASAYFTLLHFYTWLVPFGRMAVFGSYMQGSVSTLLLGGCWLAVMALLASVFVLRKRCPIYSFGVALAFLAFLPVSNLLGLGNGPYGDYYLGLSSMGFSLAAVSVCSRILYLDGLPRLLLLVGASVFLGSRAFGIVEAAEWVRCWGSKELSAKANVRTFPRAYYAHVVLARVFCDGGRYAEALAECDVADALTGLDSDKASSSFQVRALCAMLGSGDAKAALAWIARAEAVDSHPENRRMCHYYRGCVYEDLMNDPTAAEREYVRAIPAGLSDWNADTAQCVDRYARLLALRGEVRAAVELWEKALRQRPDDRSIDHNLHIARQMLK